MNNETERKQTSLIFLVGFMGVGKTSVGTRLARILSWSFVDLDNEVEHYAGSTIKELFQHRGEPYFRRLEKEQLERVSLLSKTVVALGGGAFCESGNQEMVSCRGTAVWLDAPIDWIYTRIDLGSRPLAGEPGEMASLLERRRPCYQKAPVHIKINDRSIDALAQEIVDQLQRRGLI